MDESTKKEVESDPNSINERNLIDTPSRTAYLPLISPNKEEKPLKSVDSIKEEGGKSIDNSPTKRRRESTTEGDDKLGYFDIKKVPSSDDSIQQKSNPNRQIDSSGSIELSESSSSSKQSENSDSQAHPVKRARIPLISLPDEIGNPLMRAIEQSLGGAGTSGSGAGSGSGSGSGGNDSTIDEDDEYETSSTASLSTSGKYRIHRAMSVPRNLRSKVHPVTTLMIASSSRRPSNAPSISSISTEQPNSHYTHQQQRQHLMTEKQRRNSMRVQQLSLLASQARLASTGTSNVNTALRTEQAVKGAVKRAFEDNQALRKQRESNAGLITNDETDDNGEVVPSLTAEKEEERIQRIQDPIHTWSEALADPNSATSFLDSAKEVANHWANGFYAYEKEWIGSALQKEQQKIEADKKAMGVIDNGLSNDVFEKDESDEDQVEGRQLNARRTSLSAPPLPIKEDLPGPVSEKDIVIAVQAPAKISFDIGTVKQRLVEAQRRLSKTILPITTTATTDSRRTSLREGGESIAQFNQIGMKSRNGSIAGNGNGGKLVDVLSDFATLIDNHKEGCHSLEKLAQNARRLSAVQLPSVIQYNPTPVSPSSRQTTNQAAAAAAMAASMSAVSSEAGSPLSVMGSTVG